MDPDTPSTSSTHRASSGIRRRRPLPVPTPVVRRRPRRLAESVIRPIQEGPADDIGEEVPAGAPRPAAAAVPARRSLPGGRPVITDLLGSDLRNHPSAYLCANEVPEFTQPRGNWFSIYSLYHSLHQDYRDRVDAWGFRAFFTIAPRRCPWGYMRALAERWFHHSQSLHLLDCEVMMTPQDWRYITGIEFGGQLVRPEADITPVEVRRLLGFSPQDQVFKSRSIRSGALAVEAMAGILSEPFPEDAVTRDYFLRRLFLIIMRGCFLANNSSTVHFSVVGAIRDVDRIGDFDWGSFTFAFFLQGMRLRSEGQTDAWLGFYPFLLVSPIIFSCLAPFPVFVFVLFDLYPLLFQFWAYERLSCLRPVTLLGLSTYPRGRRWHQSTLEETPVSDSFAHCRLQLELQTHHDVTWVPYSSQHLEEGFADGVPVGPEFALSTRRVPFLTDGGWELYLGERAFRCVTGEVRIPYHPPLQRFWSISTAVPADFSHGEDGYLLSTGPSTSEAFQTWWCPRTIGAQTRATHFLGDIVPGSLMMTEWMTCYQDPSHASQIAALTQQTSALTLQVDQLSSFIRDLGRDPSEAYTRRSGGGSGAGPSCYIPDLNFTASAHTSIPSSADLDGVAQFDDDDVFIDVDDL